MSGSRGARLSSLPALEHPSVYRSALVGVGHPERQMPVVCIQVAEKDARRVMKHREALTSELLQLARANELTKNIKTVLYHPAFPVDARHNSKIFREKLAVWAAQKL